MKLAVSLGFLDQDWEASMAFILAAEQLGIDYAWSVEAWGYDAVAPLAYLAARTERIRLGTGIIQVGTRSPALLGMTALSLALLSKNRFILGLGVSGPQVMEGWHGVRFDRPVQRTRETIEIVRAVCRGERLSYQGAIYQLPLPSGEGKALVPAASPNAAIPIYLAALGPKNLELTGELADGWLGTSFIPEHAAIFWDPIARGAQRVGRSLSDLDLQVNAGYVAFGDEMNQLIAPRKPGIAFTLGAMGSRDHNFYNQVFQRAGYTELALEVQDLWLKHQREAAAALIPNELVLQTNLIGTPEMVRERLRAHRRAGVTALNVATSGSLAERMHTLEQLQELLREVDGEDAR